MDLTLTRDRFGPGATISTLLWDGKVFGVALEDEDRGLDARMSPEQIANIKVAAETAIPVGRYLLRATWSPRYQRQMLLVHDVPGFQGIRIHPGNDEDDTAGCILPGMVATPGKWQVERSRVACNWLEATVAATWARGETVHLVVQRDPDAWAQRFALPTWDDEGDAA